MKRVLRALLVTLCAISPCFEAYSSPLSQETVTAKKLASNLSYLQEVKDAIVQIDISVNNNGTKYELKQSGFFVLPSLIMTSIPSNMPEEIKLECKNIKISEAGQLNLRKSKKAGFKCVNIPLLERKHGVLSIITDKSSEAHISLIPSEGFSFERNPAFALLGYSFDKRLTLSSRCRVRDRFSQIAKRFDVDPYSWSDVSCLSYNSMVGAPVLTRGVNEKLHAAGVFSSLSDVQGKDPTISDKRTVVKFPYQFQKLGFLKRLNEPPPVCAVTTETQQIDLGDHIVFTVRVKGQALSYSVNDGVMENVPATSSFDVKLRPRKSGDVLIKVKGLNGEDKCSVPYVVNYIPSATCRIVAPSVVEYGQKFDVDVFADGTFDKLKMQTTGFVSIKKIKESHLRYVFSALQDMSLEAKVESFSGATYCEKEVRVKRSKAPTCDIDAPKSVKKGSLVKVKFSSKGAVTAWNYQVNSERAQQLDSSKSTNQVTIRVNRKTKIESEVIGSGSRTSCVATINIL